MQATFTGGLFYFWKMNIAELYEIYKQYPSVQTDTRKLKKNDLFFALKGPSYDANAFAETALGKGASYAIIDDPAYQHITNTIIVDDVLNTLQQLALQHRNQFTIPFIAITGSNGKTTTKELVHTVLSTRYKTYTTAGNLNNHIGVPLTILSIRPDAEMAVIEMGANHIGEIASYCLYTLPDYGVITNIGKAHLEGFGGMEGVKKGKGELYDFLRENGGTAFVLSDDAFLREMSEGIENIVTYGGREATLIQGEPFLKLQAGGLIIHTQIVGTYNFPNVLAALAIGKYFKVEDSFIKKAIEAYIPGNSRSQLIEKDGNTIILDAYNANPSSMRAAIENFARKPAKNKVLMLGAMAELGRESLKEHEEIVDLIKTYRWKDVILVGGDFLNTPSPYKTFKNAAEAAEWFAGQRFENTHFLVKGSRSQQMEKVLG